MHSEEVSFDQEIENDAKRLGKIATDLKELASNEILNPTITLSPERKTQTLGIITSISTTIHFVLLESECVALFSY